MKPIPLPIQLGLIALLAASPAGCLKPASEQGGLESRRGVVRAEAGQPSELMEQAPRVVVHIDPKTGQIITPSDVGLPGPVVEAPLESTRKPAAALHQIPSPLPGGGVMIELDERFQTPLTATVGPDGKVQVEHKRTMPGADDRK